MYGPSLVLQEDQHHVVGPFCSGKLRQPTVASELLRKQTFMELDEELTPNLWNT